MKDKELYQSTIPVLVRFLINLDAVLDKGRRHTTRGKVSEKKLVEGRLAPDMFNLTKQVGYAYFTALEMATNLTGKQMPEFTYDEKNIKELRASVARVIRFLKTIKEKDFSKSAGKRIETFLHPGKRYGRDVYVHDLALPNFFFHVTTAYDILRNKGVPIGKDDYLGIKK